eukprot:TRINITY_DN672_c0_g1_i2.p1 TRINITY_DN672_c0_g1~~TRINITY_DN672_c0_g1_i2.p1  ORF type:complete len:309 (+),score=77.72 TRINITY_DN672_c0_g1_i2:17-943(+)
MSSNGIPKRKGGQKKRVTRAIEKREPKIEENIKNGMFVRGTKSSLTINTLLKDLYSLKKPNAVNLSKKNKILPFDDSSNLEFLSRTNDASVFVFGNDSKKRPDNLILGRMFDHHLLDMIEIGVTNFKSLESFKNDKAPLGNKPCFIFSGEEFEQKEEFQKLSNILLDMFRGAVTDTVNLMGLEHVIICTSAVDKFFFRTYRVKLKKSGSKIPHVELEEMGPSFDGTIRRTQFASIDLIREATKVPRESKPRKIKNIRTDALETKGTLHMGHQEFSNLQGKVIKSLRSGKRSGGAVEESQPKRLKPSEE